MIWKSPLPPIPSVTCTVYEFAMETIDKAIEKEPTKKSMVSATNPKISMTYVEMKQRVRKLEAFLHSRNFRPGDVAATFTPNSIDIFPFFLAVTGRRGTFSGLPPLFTEYELKLKCLEHEIKVILTTEEHLELILKVIPNSLVQTVICLFTSDKSVPENVFSWESVLSNTLEEAPKHNGQLDDVVTMMYSSGTTGAPKGILITNYNYISAVLGSRINYLNHITPTIFPSLIEEEIVELWKQPQLVYVPMYHTYGNFLTMLFLALGAPAVVLETFTISLLLEKIQEYKIWIIFLSPPLLLKLTKDDITANYDLSSLRYANSSAAPLGKELVREFAQKFPHIKVAQALGMSEALASFVNIIDDLDLPFGVPGAGWEAKIVSPSGEELDVNCSGEIVVRGPGVMKGYHKNPEATEAVIDRDGWYKTGDVGYFNEKGHLYVEDRLKEMIKVNALQVAPAELESALTSDPRITDAAVIGVPHLEKGEVPKAFIVRKSEAFTEDDAKAIIKEKLANYKWLEGGIEFVQEIPRLPSGKILRRDLRKYN